MSTCREIVAYLACRLGVDPKDIHIIVSDGRHFPVGDIILSLTVRIKGYEWFSKPVSFALDTEVEVMAEVLKEHWGIE